MKNPSSRIRGFTLLELMVVMLIIGITAAFLIPAASTIVKGSQVVQASQIITDQFSLARQYALSTNHPVELRLIRYADPEVPGEVINGVSTPTNGQFRAIQIVQDVDTINSSGNPVMMRVALDKMQVLPQSIVMDQYDQFSPLIAEAQAPASSNGIPNPAYVPIHTTPQVNIDPSLPRNVNYNYDYVAFRFNIDGSTNLPLQSKETSGNWFVTLRSINDVNPQMQGTVLMSGNHAVNFFTLAVDPVTGVLKQFRPGI
jgi:uncharacterized protein (TIGR02596 family)